MQNTYFKSFFPLVLLFSTAIFSSCATVSRGSQTYFVIETVPSGAKVSTDLLNQSEGINEYYGCAATPCKINMSRRSQFNVMLTKEGYEPFFYIVREKEHTKSLKKTSKIESLSA